MFNYQAITIRDDEDIYGMFDVYNQHQFLSGFQFLVQYEQQPSSTTNVKTTVQSPQIHKTPYTDYHTMITTIMTYNYFSNKHQLKMSIIHIQIELMLVTTKCPTTPTIVTSRAKRINPTHWLKGPH